MEVFKNLVCDISNNPMWSKLGVFSPKDDQNAIDIEYIVELSNIIINNIYKTDYKLRNFELSPSDAKKIEQIFAKILNELNSILPCFSKTRWRKKKDFYTLFQVFSENETSLPLSTNSRNEALIFLNEFEYGIDRYDEIPEGKKDELPEYIKKYGKAIAPSIDHSNSKNLRYEALSEVMSYAWKS